MARHPLEDMLYPPFAGFPKEALSFLRRLKRNNNRPWFQKHKDEYEENVRFPMECLIATIGPKLADVAPDFDFHPKKSIFRIYRDTRFSNNKTPYKTNIAASFQPRGKKSPTEQPGLYLGIDLGEIFIGGGLYMPSGEQLKSIRHSIAERPEEYLALIEDPAFKKMFGAVIGEKLVKAPLGYPKDHPMIVHLRLKQFFVGKEYGEEECLKPRFAETAGKVLLGTMPFVRWLEKALKG
jgi:uncharacterized protein (TIGR02453 family)